MATKSGSETLTASPDRRTRVRTVVFLLLFFGITINYMDRINFAVSTPLIQKQFGFSIATMGQISFAWALAYAIFNFPGGWIADKLGLRKAASFAIGWWSIFTILTALAYSLGSWFIIRGLMGIGEAPIWPINAQATRNWSSAGERSKAFTLPGSGQFVGPAFGSIVAGWIAATFGWQWTFITFGVLGLLWIPIWWALVRDTPRSHPWVNENELRFIQGLSGTIPSEKEGNDLTHSEIKAAVRLMLTRNGVGIFLTFLTFGYILFTFLNWLPSYMFYTFHLSVATSATWASFSYLAGFVGFLISGPVNDWLVVRFGYARGRKMGAGIPMLLMVIMMLFALKTSQLHLVFATALLIGLSLMVMNMSVGAWAVNAVDLAPPGTSAFVYGIYNGVLNLMGAFNSLILTYIAGKSGFIAAFSSAVAFMVVFLIGLLFVTDSRGTAKKGMGIE